MRIEVPRDRNGDFEPVVAHKGQSRLRGFNDRIIALYARGMTVRDIRAHLHEIYGVQVSPDLISRVTNAVLDEVREWQSRPLDRVYAVIYRDAIRCKVRSEGTVVNKAALPGRWHRRRRLQSHHWPDAGGSPRCGRAIPPTNECSRLARTGVRDLLSTSLES